MSNIRNARTTHPKIRSRRERALSLVAGKKNSVAAEFERIHLVRKLDQRKQGCI